MSSAGWIRPLTPPMSSSLTSRRLQTDLRTPVLPSLLFPSLLFPSLLFPSLLFPSLLGNGSLLSDAPDASGAAARAQVRPAVVLLKAREGPVRRDRQRTLRSASQLGRRLIQLPGCAGDPPRTRARWRGRRATMNRPGWERFRGGLCPILKVHLRAVQRPRSTGRAGKLASRGRARTTKHCRSSAPQRPPG
jgi:hypothetical protein